MASVGTADTWREAGGRSARSAGTPGSPRGSRSTPSDRSARPPLPPLPPLPSQGRSGAPAQRPVADQRAPGQGRPVQGRPAQRPTSPSADRNVPSRPQEDYGRATPGYPRSSASLASDTKRPPARPQIDEAGSPAPGRGSRAASRATEAAPERGSRLRGSVAILGVLVGTLAAGFLDAMGSRNLGLITLIGLVVSTAVATLLVRRRDLVSLVIAPPLVYFTAVAIVEFVHRPPGSGPKKVLAEVAAELALGQGFTVMAAATGTALVLALLRWAARR